MKLLNNSTVLDVFELVSTIPLPVIVIDKRFAVIHFNPLGADFLKISSYDLDTLDLFSLFPQLSAEDFQLKKSFELKNVSLSGINYNINFNYEPCGLNEDLRLIYVTKYAVAQQKLGISEVKLNYLKKKVNIYDAFLNNLKEGVMVFNEYGNLIYSNRNSKSHFAGKLGGNSLFWELFDHCNSQTQWEDLKSRIDAKREENFLQKIQKDNNDYTFSLEISHKVIDQLKYYLLIYIDISDSLKDKIEISKRDSELELFHKNNLVSNFEFIFKSGKTSYLSHLSDSFEKIFQVNIDLNNPNWLKTVRFHPEDFKNLISRLTVVETNISDFNFIGRLIVNQQILWFEINSKIEIFGPDLVLKGIIKNITAIKNKEDDLKNKTVFNDLVLDYIPADIALFDKDHNYLFINANGVREAALRDWLIGKNDFDYCALKGIDTSLAQLRRDYFTMAIETKQQVNWIDKIEKEGNINYISRRFFPFFIDGFFQYMIGYGIDVTELKNAQNKLDEQNSILLEKNKELERFAYVASHDLQEPLSSIIGYSKLFKDEYFPILDDEGKLYINFIAKSVERMKMLISALMEYSRIDKKELPLQVDLNNLLHEVNEDLSDIIQRHESQITSDLLPSIICFPSFIRSLFQNLISNAIKFTAPGITPMISISSEEREMDWLFKIRDNGVGIDSRNFEEIFLIFKRLHNSQDYPGNGIGLAHCKKIVSIHNGNIWVESTLNEGSTFHFTISKYV